MNCVSSLNEIGGAPEFVPLVCLPRACATNSLPNTDSNNRLAYGVCSPSGPPLSCERPGDMLRRLSSEWMDSWIRRAFRGRTGPSRIRPRHRPQRAQTTEALESRLLLAAPIANPDQYSLAHDRSFTPVFGVLQNDTDADFEPLAAQLVSSPANGTLTLQSNGLFTYTPQSGFLGTDQFTYVAADATSTSLPATVTLTVTNTAPVALADTFSITRDLFDSVAQGAPRLTANDTEIGRAHV